MLTLLDETAVSDITYHSKAIITAQKSSKGTEMVINPKPVTKIHTKSPNGYPTIGFLNASGLQFFHQVWNGVADVARENNVNAISFVGQYVRDTRDFKAQANILYDLIDTGCLDGLVIQDLMCNMLNPDEAQQFYKRYQSLPIVSIGRRSIDGIPCVQSDGYEGMRKSILLSRRPFRQLLSLKGY